MTLVTSDGSWAPAAFPERTEESSLLREILSRPHETKAWVDSTSRGSTETRAPWGSFMTPSTSAVRWRGQFVLVNHSGNVHIVGADGELVLTPEEDQLLWLGWANL